MNFFRHNSCILAAVLAVLSVLMPDLSAQTAVQHGKMQIVNETNSRRPVRYGGDYSDAVVRVPVRYEAKANEFRGIWVATVENIDFPKHERAVDFRLDFLMLLNRVKQAGFTALIFQVRPCGDAFYPSKYSPWSRYLAGKEGVALDEPDFDPLKFMIEETHKAGLEFHAWLNPYRITPGTEKTVNAFMKQEMSESNFARMRPSYVLAVPNGAKKLLIFNPGEPEVLLRLAETVKEIITNYDVDAIHFDDYFYPYQGIGDLDGATYRKYAKHGISIEDWRRKNVDTLVNRIGKMIRTHNEKNAKNVKFGISPFGIWANKPAAKDKKTVKSNKAGSLSGGSQSYFVQFADSRKWVKEGWIDYVAPQIYWSFASKNAAYAALADWWADTVKGTSVKLYVGHSFYRAGSQPDWKNVDEIPNQLKFNVLRPEIKGSAFFSYRSLFRPENPVQRAAAKKIIEEYWGGTYSPERK